MNRHDIGSIWFRFRAYIVLARYLKLTFGSALLPIALPRKGFKLSVETSDLAHAGLAMGAPPRESGLDQSLLEPPSPSPGALAGEQFGVPLLEGVVEVVRLQI